MRQAASTPACSVCNMANIPEPIVSLAKQFAKLPGVGQRTAQRYAFSLLSMDADCARELAEAITSVKTAVHTCPKCGCYTANEGECDMCLDPKRNGELLCVVENARDVYYMDDMRNGFEGRFHVLGGVLSPIDGIGPDDLNIALLCERVKKDGIREVIIATEPDVEGDATAGYIAKLLKPMGVKVSRIAYGMPIGSNIEYVDAMTLSLAIEGRREM